MTDRNLRNASLMSGNISRTAFLAQSGKASGQQPAVLDEKYRNIAGGVSRENRKGGS